MPTQTASDMKTSREIETEALPIRGRSMHISRHSVAADHASQTAPLRLPPVERGALLVPRLSLRVFAKDEEVFAEGDRAGCIYRIVTGAARTTRLLSDGRRQITAFHLAGDIFGLESDPEHRFCAESLGKSTIGTYRHCSLDTLAMVDAHLAGQIMRASIVALGRAQDHMLLLGRQSAIEKIATFLLDLSGRFPNDEQIDLPMSRIDIADHLGMTIATVSRALTLLVRDEIIAIPAHRRSITIRNRAALKRLNS